MLSSDIKTNTVVFSYCWKNTADKYAGAKCFWDQLTPILVQPEREDDVAIGVYDNMDGKNEDVNGRGNPVIIRPLYERIERMSFLDEIKKSIKSAKSYAAPVKTATNAKHPRDNVALVISNSLKFLKDSSFRIRDRKGNTKAPELCYSLKDGVATVRLSYSRQFLDLGGGDKFIDCDEAELEALLQLMQKGVTSGKLDKELEEIRDKRNKSQKNGTRAKKAK